MVLKILKKGSSVLKMKTILCTTQDSGSKRECILSKQVNFQICIEVLIGHINVSFMHPFKRVDKIFICLVLLFNIGESNTQSHTLEDYFLIEITLIPICDSSLENPMYFHFPFVFLLQKPGNMYC